MALRLRLTTSAAGTRADDARVLVHRFPRVLDALADGRITLTKAKIIAEGCAELNDKQAGLAEERVLARAGRQTNGQLREAVRRAVAAVDPQAAERRHERKRRDRAVMLYPERDGMATLSATLPAAEAVGVWGVLDQHARACSGADERTMDARRADALVDLVLDETGFTSAGAGAGADNLDGAPSSTPEPPTTDEAATTGPGVSVADTAADVPASDSAAATDSPATNVYAGQATGPADADREGDGDSAGQRAEDRSDGPFTSAAFRASASPRSGRVDPEPRLHWSGGRSPHPLFTHDDDPDLLFSRAPAHPSNMPPTPPAPTEPPEPPDRSRLPGLAPPCAAPTRRGRVSVQIRVTVPLDVLTGASDLPAELSGYGPIPAATARVLAADPDSVWRRLVTDPLSGAMLDVGTTRYRPPAALTEHVISRHTTCQFPGCRTPAHRCDLDHNVPFGDPDGVTSSANLGPKCRPHHRLKGQPGWQVQQYPDGTIEWTTPSGHQYTVEPPPVGPITAQPTAEPLNKSGTDDAPPF